jgi:hypothetical protein
MKPTPQSIIDDMNKFRRCARYKEGCEGRLTIEHCFGRMRQERWQCIWLCEKHHGLGEWSNEAHFSKEKNKYYAYLQTTDDHLKTYKTGEQMIQERRYLLDKYNAPAIARKTAEERKEMMRNVVKARWAKKTEAERKEQGRWLASFRKPVHK